MLVYGFAGKNGINNCGDNMKLNKSQRKELSKTLFDVSKLVVVVIILNPLASKENIGIKLGSAIFGVIATIVLSIWALSLLEGEE